VTISSSVLALCAVVVVAVAWLYYLWLIPKERVPERPLGFVAAMAAGVSMSGASLMAALREEETIAPFLWVLAGVGAGLAAFFVYLLKQAALPDGEIRVVVGGKWLAFAALDADGDRFHSDELRGKRVLLKFFRGHW